MAKKLQKATKINNFMVVKQYLSKWRDALEKKATMERAVKFRIFKLLKVNVSVNCL